MDINKHTKIKEILENIPECQEFLYPYYSNDKTYLSLAELSEIHSITVTSLIKGIQRYIKRTIQNPCNYEQMRKMLIKPGAVNIAGFVNFLWQEPFICEMKAKADKQGIELNINIFPKHQKKQFQNYLAVCNNPDDLPEFLIGKGFSSFITSRFVDTFVKPGHYQYPSLDNSISDFFKNNGFEDTHQSFHPFGIEELVMVYDATYSDVVGPPQSWEDILKSKYKGLLGQMGKEQQDHFCFIMMLYLYKSLGIDGIKHYAANVKIKQHFTHTIKNIGKHSERSAPVNIMHLFAAKFIRSDAREQVHIIDAQEGNPSVCYFFLLKKTAPGKAVEIAQHLYSEEIKSIIEKTGTIHISSSMPLSGNKNIRWVGWDTLRELRLPYFKEQLSEIANNYFKP